MKKLFKILDIIEYSTIIVMFYYIYLLTKYGFMATL